MAGQDEQSEGAPTLEAHIAEEVIRARTAAGLSQRALAEGAGVNQAMVSRLESGARLPRLDTLLALAEATGHVLEIRLKRPRGAGRDTGGSLRGR